MNIGLRDRNLNQSLTSAERVTGSMPVKQEESHLLIYSPHEAETLTGYDQQLKPREATAVLNIRQVFCFEVETLSDPEEHVSRPVASEGSGKCLSLLACPVVCSPCDK